MRNKYKNIHLTRSDKEIYWQYYFKLEEYCKELVDDIFARTPNLVPPVEMVYLHDYLSGYSFEYRSFDGNALRRKFGAKAVKVDGCWDLIEETEGGFRVLYNESDSPKRQRFTQAHETFHIFQLLDPEFRTFIDEFYQYHILPEYYIKKLIENSADMCSAFYLLPEKQLREEYQKNQGVFHLSESFQVSMRCLGYRLKNSGIYVPS